jgi:Ca2+-binding EF-hand superfamily protein
MSIKEAEYAFKKLDADNSGLVDSYELEEQVSQ